MTNRKPTIKDFLGDYDHDHQQKAIDLPELDVKEGENSMTPAMLRQQ